MLAFCVYPDYSVHSRDVPVTTMLLLGAMMYSGVWARERSHSAMAICYTQLYAHIRNRCPDPPPHLSLSTLRWAGGFPVAAVCVEVLEVYEWVIH